MPTTPRPPDEWVVDFPTLGPLVERWIEHHCVVPDKFHKGEPYVMADWQAWCTYNHYRVRPTAVWRPENPLLGTAFHYRRSQVVAPQKALALDTPIATPDGWTTMGEVAVGDTVFNERGGPTRVTAKSPVWTTDTFRVSLSDGSSLLASADHEWWVERRTPSATYVPDRVTTSQLLGQLVDRHGARRFRIPVARPLDLRGKSLPIDPYTLGAWLGDGERGGGRITGLDDEVFARIELGGLEVRVTKIAKRRQVIGLVGPLRQAGVLHNKHIPGEYLRASEKQRWALLQGLMDTDGYADERQGKCEFTTVLPALRDGCSELLYSLGIKHTVYEGLAKLDGRVTGPKWRINFAARSDMPVFGLLRKQTRLRAPGRGHAQSAHRRIVAVEQVATVPTQCLTVAASSHVFLAGREMIPTSNCGKGPWAASIISNEAAGPALFAGWAKRGDAYDCADHGCPCGWGWDYEPGEPMGMPWPTPLIQLTAFSDDQTDNTYGPLSSMIRNGRLGELLKVREGFIKLPGGGKVETVTSSAQSRLGNPITFALQDESQLYTKTNNLHATAETQRRGVAGMGGRSMETTNCWNPAENSTAQKTHESPSADIFRFYRRPPTHLSYRNKVERRAIHRFNYDGSWWVDIDSIEAEAAELMETDPAQAERFFGNRIVQGQGAWLPDGLWTSAELKALPASA